MIERSEEIASIDNARKDSTLSDLPFVTFSVTWSCFTGEASSFADSSPKFPHSIALFSRPKSFGNLRRARRKAIAAATSWWDDDGQSDITEKRLWLAPRASLWCGNRFGRRFRLTAIDPGNSIVQSLQIVLFVTAPSLPDEVQNISSRLPQSILRNRRVCQFPCIMRARCVRP